MNNIVKILRIIFTPFRLLYRFIDKYIIIPISKFIYTAYKRFKLSPKIIEKFFSRPNILLYVSLALAIIMFFFVDNKTTRLVENEAEILDNQPVTLIYNEEAFVVDGVPKTVDITLIGRRSDLYLAKQLGNHKVTLDLSGYSEGNHKVKLKYNHSVETVKYKLDPSTINVVISPKVSAVKSLTYDIYNQDKLDLKLSIGTVSLEHSEVVIKGSKNTLDKVATVKALVDVGSDKLTGAGNFKIENVPLVAYDENGKIINNVEIVPKKINADVTVTSNNVEVPVKVITDGTATVGFAISDISSSVSKVTLYGEQSILSNIKYIEAVIDIDGLNENKTYSVTLTKPNGVRYMSASTTSVEVTVQQESSVEITVSPIVFRNLDSKYAANASSIQDTSVVVIVKGVKSVLNSIDQSNITAYVDLTGFGPGNHDVPIIIEGSDPRLTFTPKVKTISVVISNKK